MQDLALFWPFAIFRNSLLPIPNWHWQFANTKLPIPKIKIAWYVKYIHTTRSYNQRVRPLTQYDSPRRFDTLFTADVVYSHTDATHCTERVLKDRRHLQRTLLAVATLQFSHTQWFIMLSKKPRSLDIAWEEIRRISANHQRSPSFKFSRKLNKMLSLGDFVEVSYRENETSKRLWVPNFGNKIDILFAYIHFIPIVTNLINFVLCSFEL